MDENSKRKERAEAMLELTPEREYTLEADGILAALYRPTADAFPGKALIVLGGGEGVYPLTKFVAERFCLKGMTSLALAYWAEPGLPSCVTSVPIECVRKAAEALRGAGAERVGIWGISKGAELALVAGSMFPELIGCVVAASPIDVVCQGLGPGSKGLSDGSSWSYEGRDLPFFSTRFSTARILADCIRARGLSLRSCYVDLEGPNPEAAEPSFAASRIKVEKIAGPVLLLSSAQDGMWPAAQASERMMRVLDAAGHPYEHTHLAYQTVSHFILPADLGSARMYATERRNPAECSRERADSTERTLEFLARW